MITSFIALAFLAGSANVKTIINTQVSGESSSVNTEIVNTVNQKTTKIETDQVGEIKVEIINDEVKIETSPEISPKITISQEETVKGETIEVENEPLMPITDKKNKFFSFFRNLFSKFAKIFNL